MPYKYDKGTDQFVESYGEVDDDKPYMPRQLDWTDYTGTQHAYNDFLGSEKARLDSGGGVGAAAMRSGLGQAQLAMQAQAVGRGANPGNERAALYAGGQMQRHGALQAAQMTQEEYAQLRAMEDAYRRQNMQNAISQQAMEMQRQQMMSNNYNAAVGADQAATNADWSHYSGLVGTVIGAAAGASDVRVKENISAPSPAAQDATIRGMQPYQWNYRPEYADWAARVSGMPAGARDGRQSGVMAQDLEQTPLGSTMVYEDPQTGRKVIDGAQATTTTMGLVGRLGDRADDLEARLAALEAQRQATGRKGGRRA